MIEAAWAYRYRPAVGAALRKRQASASEEVKAIAWKAQHRLHARYRHLMARGKCKQQTVTAVGRELIGVHLGHRGARRIRNGVGRSLSRRNEDREQEYAATVVVEGHTERRTLD